ncbi:helix-turn-helix transcriptional regulator [Pseudoalteromonas sp. MMG013]|uniref:helix-turn-helix domain-containing protein n=1 Tax=Pseudoalteromonas sp. MMG013 TaxID=2822687 RepID=UPI001B399522|nr:helix-turn-helix transcriptional regulator [Pseudoalteromonas sp. MMG013]MBQ4863986.1 helix-turn-helix transcriptional regulator [Pseudoalteromonas sp. MMG013]
MSQISLVSDTLKMLLKQRKMTYKDIAGELDMSEANIKRIFANQSFTLQRLEQICNLLQISLSDLFSITQKQQSQLTELTFEQEQELIDNPKLLLVAVCVRDAWDFQEIIAHYEIDKFELIQLFARLDKIKLIQLLPNNHYKLLIAQDFRWLKNGPLERFMEQEVLHRFMASKFDEPNSFRFYLRGRYSQSSIEVIQRKLNQLTKESAILNQEDASLPLSTREHMGLLFAMRPWEPSLFEQFRRKKDI